MDQPGWAAQGPTALWAPPWRGRCSLRVPVRDGSEWTRHWDRKPGDRRALAVTRIRAALAAYPQRTGTYVEGDRAFKPRRGFGSHPSNVICGPIHPDYIHFKQINRLYNLVWWARPRHGVLTWQSLGERACAGVSQGTRSRRGHEMTGGESAPVCEQITAAITNDYQAWKVN